MTNDEFTTSIGPFTTLLMTEQKDGTLSCRSRRIGPPFPQPTSATRQRDLKYPPERANVTLAERTPCPQNISRNANWISRGSLYCPLMTPNCGVPIDVPG